MPHFSSHDRLSTCNPILSLFFWVTFLLSFSFFWIEYSSMDANSSDVSESSQVGSGIFFSFSCTSMFLVLHIPTLPLGLTRSPRLTTCITLVFDFILFASSKSRTASNSSSGPRTHEGGFSIDLGCERSAYFQLFANVYDLILLRKNLLGSYLETEILFQVYSQQSLPMGTEIISLDLPPVPFGPVPKREIVEEVSVTVLCCFHDVIFLIYSFHLSVALSCM